MSDSSKSDLIVLVADKYMKLTLDAILSNYHKLKIRKIEFDVLSHPQHDSGCFKRGHEFISLFLNQYTHCLIIFDHHGCGREKNTREEVEDEVRERLSTKGWEDRAEAIVIDPELEAWVWSDSPHVNRFLGWEQLSHDLRSWLEEKGLWSKDQLKPHDPKLAVEQALRYVQKPISSSIYKQIAEAVSFDRCSDPAFLKLKTTLKSWFGNSNPS